MTFNILTINSSKKKGYVGQAEVGSNPLRRNGRGVREAVFIFQHLRPTKHTWHMLISRFFPEQRVGFTRGAFSSISSSRPSRRWISSRVANATASAAVGKRSSIPRTAAIGCCHMLLTGVDNDVSRCLAPSSSGRDSSQASVADVAVWGGVVCRVVVWSDTRTSMRLDFPTFPMHASDWRVGSKISVFPTVWSSWKSSSKNVRFKRHFFNCVRMPFFVSDRKPAFSNPRFRLHKKWPYYKRKTRHPRTLVRCVRFFFPWKQKRRVRATRSRASL